MFQLLQNTTAWWTVIAIFVSFMWLWWRRPCPNFPPGPRGLPFVGVLFYLLKDPQPVLRKWGFKYGSVSSARLGQDEVVYLNTYDSHYQALVKQASEFGGRGKLELFSSFIGNNGIVLRTTDRDQKVQKAFLMQTLKNCGMGKKEMENIINEESQHFVEYLQTKVDEPFCLQDELYKVIANVLMKLVAGERHEYDEKMFQKLCESQKNQIHGPMQASLLFVALNFYDLVKYIPPFTMIKRVVKQAEKDFSDNFRPIIERHRETFDPNSCRDYIDAYILEQERGEKKESSFTDRNMEVCVRDLFVAGTDSSASTLSWLILGILNYPNYYKIIQNEIDSNIGKSEPPSMKKIKDLPMLCAFIEEMMRRHPIGPNTFDHVTLKDTTLFGYNIPKGTRVIPNVYSIQLDAKIWPDPEKFDPYRHIDKNGKFVSSGKLVNFSMGNRSCPGESLARMEIPLVLVNLLQYYTIEASSDGLPALDSGFGAVIISPKRYNIVLKLR